MENKQEKKIELMAKHKSKMMKILAGRDWHIGIVLTALIALLIINLGFVSGAVQASTPPTVTYSTATVCCEETKSHLACQNVPASECLSANAPPTSCESTSFCKAGYCFNSFDGTCAPSVAKATCTASGGTWSETFPAACELGCCVMGDQASFTTMTKCKQMSGMLGISMSYKKDIKDEVSCALVVAGQEKGACVYEKDFETTCKFTSREDCVKSIKGNFYKDKLCTDNTLGTNCAPTTTPKCAPGKEDAYFTDTCGNIGNIYSSGKVNDVNYWSDVVSEANSCGANSANAGSGSCGNCNYLLGSICREESGVAKCIDLNCKGSATLLGGVTERKHGESWCTYDDKAGRDNAMSSAGSRFVKYTCNNGDVVTTPCADARQEECIQDSVDIGNGKVFSQAACKVNRWRDCAVQSDPKKCGDAEKRDCVWKVLSSRTIGGVSSVVGNATMLGNATSTGTCLPKNPPGFEFWKPAGGAESCAIASATCATVWEKRIFSSWKCKGNCYCLSTDWEKERAGMCSAMGDCGPKINWNGDFGETRGYSGETYSSNWKQWLTSLFH